jgi:hypothetical protein
VARAIAPPRPLVGDRAARAVYERSEKKRSKFGEIRADLGPRFGGVTRQEKISPLPSDDRGEGGGAPRGLHRRVYGPSSTRMGRRHGLVEDPEDLVHEGRIVLPLVEQFEDTEDLVHEGRIVLPLVEQFEDTVEWR